MKRASCFFALGLMTGVSGLARPVWAQASPRPATEMEGIRSDAPAPPVGSSVRVDPSWPPPRTIPDVQAAQRRMDRVPGVEEWTAQRPQPRATSPGWYATRFHDRLNRGGQILFPVPLPDPVTNESSLDYENKRAWGMAQSYFFQYEAPYQLGTDFHSVTIGVPGVKFGGK